MESSEQLSDQLLNEIMKLEHEIDKVMALNGNREDYVVKQYRKFISAKQKKLKQLNDDYCGFTNDRDTKVQDTKAH